MGVLNPQLAGIIELLQVLLGRLLKAVSDPRNYGTLAGRMPALFHLVYSAISHKNPCLSDEIECFVPVCYSSRSYTLHKISKSYLLKILSSLGNLERDLFD